MNNVNGTKRSNIKIGATILVFQKQDKRTENLTEGIIKRYLLIHKNSGSKVMI